jgi:hypothetical protein
MPVIAERHLVRDDYHVAPLDWRQPSSRDRLSDNELLFLRAQKPGQYLGIAKSGVFG